VWRSLWLAGRDFATFKLGRTHSRDPLSAYPSQCRVMLSRGVSHKYRDISSEAAPG
jgi:hypothetical protein